MGTHHQDEKWEEYFNPHRQREQAAREQAMRGMQNRLADEMTKKEVLNGHPGFYELLKTMADIHSRKNGNYAKASDALSNFRLSNELGIDPFKGCLIRMSDKWSRICQLSKGVPDLVGESLEDTLIDLANYSLISILLLREKRANTKGTEVEKESCPNGYR